MPDRPTFFLVHTALITPYSIALLESTGRFTGTGESFSGSGTSLDSEQYSDSSSDSEDSEGEAD